MLSLGIRVVDDTQVEYIQTTLFITKIILISHLFSGSNVSMSHSHGLPEQLFSRVEQLVRMLHNLLQPT